MSMLLDLERVIVVVDDLQAAAADFALLLGRPGDGESEGCVCFAVGNTILELSTCDRLSLSLSTLASGRPEAPGREGVAALAFREDEREADEWLGATETRGIPIRLARDESEGQPPDQRDVEALGVSGLDHVVISTGDLAAARKLYGETLGLRLALDRPFERRGIQILFFRIAGVTVEVVGRLPGAPENEGGPRAFAGDSDHFGGLAWKVDDVRAIRTRLLDEGFDVSEGRVGHKPGTCVCTVRSRTHGVPTLLIGPDL